MSKIQKNCKLGINFQTTSTFLNLNKPKLLSIEKFGKSEKYSIKNLKIKKSNRNISQDISPLDTLTKLTENNSKDEIIKALKERLTTLEKKIKILENKNRENITKNTTLNLSQESLKYINNTKNEMKFNLKLYRNKNKTHLFNNLNISNMRKESTKTIGNNNYSFKSIMNTNNKKNNNCNFYNINNFNNINNTEKQISNSESKNKIKNYIIIPRKKLFADVLKKSLIKYASIDNNILKNNKLKNDFNINIPKIPRKKNSHKSIIIKNRELVNNFKRNKDNNSVQNTNYSEKNNDIVIINNNQYNNKRNDKCNLNDLVFLNSGSNFNILKNKLENIKFRTKNLLEYYSSNNFSNANLVNSID